MDTCFLFEKQINRTKNLTKGSWKTVISAKEIWKILLKKRTKYERLCLISLVTGQKLLFDFYDKLNITYAFDYLFLGGPY